MELGSTRRGKLRPHQSNCAGRKRSGGACSAQCERLPLGTQARDLLAWRQTASPPDRMAEIGLTEGPAAQIASGDRNNPGMAGDNRGADGALITGRGHDEHTLPGGMIQRLPQRAFPFRGRWHEGKA